MMMAVYMCKQTMGLNFSYQPQKLNTEQNYIPIFSPKK